MGHIPDDDNFDDFMNASAEEWSKPEEPSPLPPIPPQKTDRWGSPIGDSGAARDPYQPGTGAASVNTGVKKSRPWWIIAILVAVVLCLCVCVVMVGLPLIGINLFQTSPLQF